MTADELGAVPAEVIRAAHMPASYATEVSKGMRLAEHVEVKS